MFLKNWIEEEPHTLENNDIVRVKQWLAILLVVLTPVLNIIMLASWAFNRSETEPKSLVNFARGAIIVGVIVAVVVAAFLPAIIHILQTN
jgi:cytosine/uracil/thiamine/allantoin permease